MVISPQVSHLSVAGGDRLPPRLWVNDFHLAPNVSFSTFLGTARNFLQPLVASSLERESAITVQAKNGFYILNGWKKPEEG